MWENKNHYNGMSVMPEDLGSYDQTPYETITEEVYLEGMKSLSNLDMTMIIEMKDNTNLMDQSGCAGPNGCEII